MKNNKFFINSISLDVHKHKDFFLEKKQSVLTAYLP